MTALIDELTHDATQRDEESGWKRETVRSIAEWRDPDLLKPFGRAYLSETSLTIKDTRTRKLVGQRISTGEISRLYLKKVMTLASEGNPNAMIAKRVPYHRDAKQFLDRHPAYYFAGQTGGPFALVDITACYASLYTRLTLDVTYRPETDPPLFGLGRGVFPRAEEWVRTKGPRNAMFGTLLRPFTREWRHGKPVDEAFPNRYFAPDLAGVVFDACHAIAETAIERFGALSWAVDGGVFRPEEARQFIEWLDVTYGLTATVRGEGPGWLFGATSYAIGPETTLDVEKGMAHEWPAVDNLRHTESRERSWLADILKERVG